MYFNHTGAVLRRENTQQIQLCADIYLLVLGYGYLADPISELCRLCLMDGIRLLHVPRLKHFMPEIDRTFHYNEHICCNKQCLVML